MAAPTQERAVATRAALLDAAIECLVERGYAGTTTIETARRAGVSRGAQQHHFPTKAELLATAVQHLVDRRLEEFREAFAAIDPDADRLDAALDLLWSMIDTDAFVAWIELWVGARTDPELAATLLEVEARFTAETRAMFVAYFPAGDGTDREVYGIARDFAFALLQGVAMERLWAPRRRPASDYVDALKHVFRLARLGE